MNSSVEIAILAQQFFQASEQAWLFGLPPALQMRGFFRLWVLKEAVLKARGTGLGELERLEIRCGRPLDGRDWVIDDEPAWDLRELDLDPDFCAAVALPAHVQQLRIVETTALELLSRTGTGDESRIEHHRRHSR